jgi:hypothetical protein
MIIWILRFEHFEAGDGWSSTGTFVKCVSAERLAASKPGAMAWSVLGDWVNSIGFNW